VFTVALNILAALVGRDGRRQFLGLARDGVRSRAEPWRRTPCFASSCSSSAAR
jgi:hypothetical protein